MTFMASATASSSQSNDDAMLDIGRRSDKESGAVPPPSFGQKNVMGYPVLLLVNDALHCLLAP